MREGEAILPFRAQVPCRTSNPACSYKTKHYPVDSFGRSMSWAEEDVRLVPVEWLKAHEEIKPKNMEKLLEMTLRWDGFTKPLIADKATGTILDGHHRYAVANDSNLLEFQSFASITWKMIRLNSNCGLPLIWNPSRNRRSSTWRFLQIFILQKRHDIAYLTICPRFMYRLSDCRCLRRVNLTRTNRRFPQTISIARCHGWVVWLQGNIKHCIMHNGISCKHDSGC